MRVPGYKTAANDLLRELELRGVEARTVDQEASVWDPVRQKYVKQRYRTLVVNGEEIDIAGAKQTPFGVAPVISFGKTRSDRFGVVQARISAEENGYSFLSPTQNLAETIADAAKRGVSIRQAVASGAEGKPAAVQLVSTEMPELGQKTAAWSVQFYAPRRHQDAVENFARLITDAPEHIRLGDKPLTDMQRSALSSMMFIRSSNQDVTLLRPVETGDPEVLSRAGVMKTWKSATIGVSREKAVVASLETTDSGLRVSGFEKGRLGSSIFPGESAPRRYSDEALTVITSVPGMPGGGLVNPAMFDRPNRMFGYITGGDKHKIATNPYGKDAITLQQLKESLSLNQDIIGRVNMPGDAVEIGQIKRGDEAIPIRSTRSGGRFAVVGLELHTPKYVNIHTGRFVQSPGENVVPVTPEILGIDASSGVSVIPHESAKDISLRAVQFAESDISDKTSAKAGLVYGGGPFTAKFGGREMEYDILTGEMKKPAFAFFEYASARGTNAAQLLRDFGGEEIAKALDAQGVVTKRGGIDFGALSDALEAAGVSGKEANPFVYSVQTMERLKGAIESGDITPQEALDKYGISYDPKAVVSLGAMTREAYNLEKDLIAQAGLTVEERGNQVLLSTPEQGAWMFKRGLQWVPEYYGGGYSNVESMLSLAVEFGDLLGEIGYGDAFTERLLADERPSTSGWRSMMAAATWTNQASRGLEMKNIEAMPVVSTVSPELAGAMSSQIEALKAEGATTSEILKKIQENFGDAKVIAGRKSGVFLPAPQQVANIMMETETGETIGRIPDYYMDAFHAMLGAESTGAQDDVINALGYTNRLINAAREQIAPNGKLIKKLMGVDDPRIISGRYMHARFLNPNETMIPDVQLRRVARAFGLNYKKMVGLMNDPVYRGQYGVLVKREPQLTTKAVVNALVTPQEARSRIIQMRRQGLLTRSQARGLYNRTRTTFMMGWGTNLYGIGDQDADLASMMVLMSAVTGAPVEGGAEKARGMVERANDYLGRVFQPELAKEYNELHKSYMDYIDDVASNRDPMLPGKKLFAARGELLEGSIEGLSSLQGRGTSYNARRDYLAAATALGMSTDALANSYDQMLGLYQKNLDADIKGKTALESIMGSIGIRKTGKISWIPRQNDKGGRQPWSEIDISAFTNAETPASGAREMLRKLAGATATHVGQTGAGDQTFTSQAFASLVGGETELAQRILSRIEGESDTNKIAATAGEEISRASEEELASSPLLLMGLSSAYAKSQQGDDPNVRRYGDVLMETFSKFGGSDYRKRMVATSAFADTLKGRPTLRQLSVISQLSRGNDDIARSPVTRILGSIFSNVADWAQTSAMRVALSPDTIPVKKMSALLAGKGSRFYGTAYASIGMRWLRDIGLLPKGVSESDLYRVEGLPIDVGAEKESEVYEKMVLQGVRGVSFSDETSNMGETLRLRRRGTELVGKPDIIGIATDSSGRQTLAFMEAKVSLHRARAEKNIADPAYNSQAELYPAMVEMLRNGTEEERQYLRKYLEENMFSDETIEGVMSGEIGLSYGVVSGHARKVADTGDIGKDYSVDLVGASMKPLGKTRSEALERARSLIDRGINAVQDIAAEGPAGVIDKIAELLPTVEGGVVKLQPNVAQTISRIREAAGLSAQESFGGKNVGSQTPLQKAQMSARATEELPAAIDEAQQAVAALSSGGAPPEEPPAGTAPASPSQEEPQGGSGYGDISGVKKAMEAIVGVFGKMVDPKTGALRTTATISFGGRSKSRMEMLLAATKIAAVAPDLTTGVDELASMMAEAGIDVGGTRQQNMTAISEALATTIADPLNPVSHKMAEIMESGAGRDAIKRIARARRQLTKGDLETASSLAAMPEEERAALGIDSGLVGLAVDTSVSQTGDFAVAFAKAYGIPLGDSKEKQTYSASNAAFEKLQETIEKTSKAAMEYTRVVEQHGEKSREAAVSLRSLTKSEREMARARVEHQLEVAEAQRKALRSRLDSPELSESERAQLQTQYAALGGQVSSLARQRVAMRELDSGLSGAISGTVKNLFSGFGMFYMARMMNMAKGSMMYGYAESEAAGAISEGAAATMLGSGIGRRHGTTGYRSTAAISGTSAWSGYSKFFSGEGEYGAFAMGRSMFTSAVVAGGMTEGIARYGAPLLGYFGIEAASLAGLALPLAAGAATVIGGAMMIGTGLSDRVGTSYASHVINRGGLVDDIQAMYYKSAMTLVGNREQMDTASRMLAYSVAGGSVSAEDAARYGDILATRYTKGMGFDESTVKKVHSFAAQLAASGLDASQLLSDKYQGLAITQASGLDFASASRDFLRGLYGGTPTSASAFETAAAFAEGDSSLDSLLRLQSASSIVGQLNRGYVMRAALALPQRGQAGGAMRIPGLIDDILKKSEYSLPLARLQSQMQETQDTYGIGPGATISLDKINAMSQSDIASAYAGSQVSYRLLQIGVGAYTQAQEMFGASEAQARIIGNAASSSPLARKAWQGYVSGNPFWTALVGANTGQNDLVDVGMEPVSTDGGWQYVPTGYGLFERSLRHGAVPAQVIANQVWGSGWQSRDISGVRDAMVNGIAAPWNPDITLKGYAAYQIRVGELQYQSQMASLGAQSQNLALRYAFTTGIGMEAYSAYDPRSGANLMVGAFKFNAPGARGSFGGGIWGYQDASLAMNKAMQDWQYRTTQARMAMTERQWSENMSLQVAQSLVVRSGTERSWALSGRERALQWGWFLEDSQRDLKFMTGRQRKMAERNIERKTTLHGIQEERVQDQKEQQRALWELEDERFRLTRKNHEETVQFQRREMEERRRFQIEQLRLSRQYQKLQRALWLLQMENQKRQLGAQAYYAQMLRDASIALAGVKSKEEDIHARRSVNLSLRTELTQAEYDYFVSRIEQIGLLKEKIDEVAGAIRNIHFSGFSSGSGSGQTPDPEGQDSNSGWTSDDSTGGDDGEWVPSRLQPDAAPSSLMPDVTPSAVRVAPAAPPSAGNVSVTIILDGRPLNRAIKEVLVKELS